MLSNACKYAIRAILYLAIETDDKNKLGAKAVAERLDIPQPFLAKLLRELAGKKIISSSKGPNGGFYLDAKNRSLSVWHIIKAIDGIDKFEQCYLGLSKCGSENPCPVHHIVVPFKERILKEFKDKNIGELSVNIDRDGSSLFLSDNLRLEA